MSAAVSMPRDSKFKLDQELRWTATIGRKERVTTDTIWIGGSSPEGQSVGNARKLG